LIFIYFHYFGNKTGLFKSTCDKMILFYKNTWILSH